MKTEDYARLTFILSLIAAALALSAALVGYVRKGELKISLVAAGVFLLALGFSARSRAASNK
jgi:vacuolar-type H+-ATPase subunit I/STV1